MKKLQVLLSRRWKGFLLLITPNKAAIYPEYIPDRIKSAQTIKTRNYDNLVPLLIKHGVNYVDGLQITREKSQLVRHPMYPHGGTHWNYLAAYYTTKAVVENLEATTGKDLVNVEISGVDVGPPVGVIAIWPI